MRKIKRILAGFLAVLLTLTLLPAVTKADPPASGCPKDPNGRHDWYFRAAYPAECTVAQRTIFTCRNCGQDYTEYSGKPMGHQWSDWDEEGEPTCTESTYATRVCNWCWEIEEKTVPALGHDWNIGKITVQPTCTKEGAKVVTCTRCGERKTVTIPKTGHTPVTIPGKAATCTETGLTDLVVCSSCGTAIRAQKTIPKTDHSWNEGIVTKMPTDTEDGEITYTCLVCGEVKTETLPAGSLAPAIHLDLVIAEDAGKGKAVDNALVYFDRVVTNTGNCPLTVYVGYEHTIGSILPDGTVLGEVDWVEVVLQPGESLTMHTVDPVFLNQSGEFELEFTSWGCGGYYTKEDGTQGYVNGNSVAINIPLTPPEGPSANLFWVESDRFENPIGEAKRTEGATVQVELLLTNDGDRPFTVKLDETASVSGYAGGSVTLDPGQRATIIQRGTVTPEMVETGVFEKQYSFTCSYKTDDGADGSLETNTIDVSFPLTNEAGDALSPSIYMNVVIAEDAGKGKAVEDAFVYYDRVITNTGNCPLTVSVGYEHTLGSVLPDGTALGTVDWMQVVLQPGESLTLHDFNPVYQEASGEFELEYSSCSCGGYYTKEDGTEGFVNGNTVTFDVLLTPPESPSARLSWDETDHFEHNAGEGKLSAGASVEAKLRLTNTGDRPFTVTLDGTASVSGIAGGSVELNPGENVVITQQDTVTPEMAEATVFEKQYSFTCSYKTDDGGDGSFETNTVTISFPLTKEEGEKLSPSIHMSAVVAEGEGNGKAVDGAIVAFDLVTTNTGNCPLRTSRKTGYANGYDGPSGSTYGALNSEPIVLQPGESMTEHCFTVVSLVMGEFILEYPEWRCGGYYTKEDGTEEYISGNTVVLDIPLTSPESPSAVLWAEWAENAGEGKLLAGAFVVFELFVVNTGDRPITVKIDENASISGIAGGSFTLDPGEHMHDHMVLTETVTPEMVEAGVFEKQYSFTCTYQADDGADASIETNSVTVSIPLTAEAGEKLSPSIYQTAVIAEDAGKGKAADGAIVEFDRVITNTGNCPLTISNSTGYGHGLDGPAGLTFGALDYTPFVLEPGANVTQHWFTTVWNNSGVYELEYTKFDLSASYTKEDGTEEIVRGNTIVLDVPLTSPEGPSAVLWAEWEDNAGEGKLLAGASVSSTLTLYNTGDRPFTVKFSGLTSISGVLYGNYDLNPGESVHMTQQGLVTPEMVEAGVFEEQYSFECYYKTDDGKEETFMTNTVTVTAQLTESTVHPSASVSASWSDDAGNGKRAQGETVKYTVTVTNTGDCPITDIGVSGTGDRVGGMIGVDGAFASGSENRTLQPGESVSIEVESQVWSEEAEAGTYEIDLMGSFGVIYEDGSKGHFSADSFHVSIPLT